MNGSLLDYAHVEVVFQHHVHHFPVVVVGFEKGSFSIGYLFMMVVSE